VEQARDLGLRLESFEEYAMTQLSRRFARVEKAREQTLEQILGTVDAEETGI
jgi:hypothetical protein